MKKSKFHANSYIQNDIICNPSLMEKERAKNRDNLFIIAITFFALCLTFLVIILSTFVIFIADVDGGSMYPTLQHGDKLITNRYKQPKVDSIITLRHKNSDGTYELWIKRVIAMGGDTVEIKNGEVYVNGQKKDESYLPKTGITQVSGKVNKWVLEEDEIFFLGDNRNPYGSYDAREVGPCKKSDVVGVVADWSVWLVGLFR